MLRNILGVTAGVLAGALLVFAVEMVGHALFPAPAVDFSDPQKARSAIAALPLATKLSVVVAWFAGAFGGGAVAALIAKRWAPVAWVVAATIFLLSASSLMAIPHPWWMSVAAALAAGLGGYLAVRVTGARYGAPAAGPRDPIAKL